MSSAPYDTNRFDGSTVKRRNIPGRHVESPKAAGTYNGRRELSHSTEEQGITTPRTGPLPASSSKPPNYITPGPKSNPSPPTFAKGQPTEPPSHPRHVGTFGSVSSYSSSKKSSTSQTSSPRSDYAVKVLPGAMSSRRESAMPRKHRSGSSKRALQRKPTLASRWKSAVKSVFTTREVDESQLVRLEDHHWTEEW